MKYRPRGRLYETRRYVADLKVPKNVQSITVGIITAHFMQSFKGSERVINTCADRFKISAATRVMEAQALRLWGRKGLRKRMR